MSRLRKIRHRHEIPGFVNLSRGEKFAGDPDPKSERIFKARSERSRRRYQSRLPAPPELQSYVEDAQHDAWLMGHRREGDLFILTASDEHTIFLAEWGFEVPWKECLFPFDLLFEGVEYVGWRREHPDGRLSWGAPFLEGVHDASWLNDTFLDSGETGVRWALSFHTPEGVSQASILLVEAARMRMVERQRDAWKRIVGEESLPIFDEGHRRRRTTPLTHPENLRAFLDEFGLPRKGAGFAV